MTRVRVTIVTDKVDDHEGVDLPSDDHILVHLTYGDTWQIAGAGLNTERGSLAAAMTAVGTHLEDTIGETVRHTAETCPGRPCSSECDHVERIGV